MDSCLKPMEENKNLGGGGRLGKGKLSRILLINGTLDKILVLSQIETEKLRLEEGGSKNP
ncbi:hypothetical protein KEJ27_03695 [Candidatus Bathyarchaeota archaeon]|nr:hypothetical protein [Candidatus Bathyarchaeota archaeon]MBS7612925.1 hypothetical protein [Candidatus Bathyarchaeota archaeon]MBS7618014.1 hypothetical protein [Candidatus Bathyarchaeota archaeon]